MDHQLYKGVWVPGTGLSSGEIRRVGRGRDFIS